MIGLWREESTWSFRPQRELEVRVPDDRNRIERLSENVALADLVGDHEVERALVRTAALAALAGEAEDWTTTRPRVIDILTQGVAAVALGGVRSRHQGKDGAAAALALGDLAVVGHLEPSIDEAAADLARRHGLPGFRFSDESWWTEDFLGAKEDPQVGREVMQGLIDAGSWPWLVLVVGAPASGIAAEAAAVTAAQTLLGALVLLDQPPGSWWGESIPWIAGGLGPAGDPRWAGEANLDWVLPISPQRVDGMNRRLDNAESDFGDAPARVLDVADHAHGPGGDVLRAVVHASLVGAGNSSQIDAHAASACRLAWLAAATETPSTRSTLAKAATDELLIGCGHERGDSLELAQAGARWRLEQDASWPERERFGEVCDLDSWARRFSEGAVMPPDDSPPAVSWGATAMTSARDALDIAQASFFAVAAGR